MNGSEYILELEATDLAEGLEMEDEGSKEIWKTEWMEVPYCVRSCVRHWQ